MINITSCSRLLDFGFKKYVIFLYPDTQDRAALFEKVALLTTAQCSTPTNRRRLSAAAKGGSGVPPDYGNPTCTHAEEGQAERSGQDERSGEGGFGGLPRLRHNTARPRAEESQVQRPGRAQWRRGVREYPLTTATQLARTPKMANPSAAARPSAAEKGISGVSPTTTQLSTPTRRRKPSAVAKPSAAE
jgi:hypothetical protein